MDVDAQAPVMTQVPAPLEMAAVGGELQPAVAPRHAAASQCRPLTSLVECGTQMEGRLYTYGEKALLLLLVSFEFLVSQETVAVRSRVSHQPALSYVRQALREGRRPGVRLPTERPIDMPAYHRRRGESAWQHLRACVYLFPPYSSMYGRVCVCSHLIAACTGVCVSVPTL
ncbi:hypothetical protein GWK47_043837 [Chionoecetes opilio]|uniref:Uncharacterized protein n=1 Tax=Chionoecetes opilio TaxID=41210 RepID=A0A8J5CYG6_CHIOP|nr:hypothetical protein GWK47_043837 [Chionoecetes opilio]